MPWSICASIVFGWFAAQLPGPQRSSGTNSAGISASNMLPPQLGTSRVSPYGYVPSYTLRPS